MPAPTPRSRRFFGAVRSYQEGRSSNVGPEVRRAAREMTHGQVRDMTKKSSRSSGRSRRRSRRS
jgi:hypothetical protein